MICTFWINIMTQVSGVPMLSLAQRNQSELSYTDARLWTEFKGDYYFTQKNEMLEYVLFRIKGTTGELELVYDDVKIAIRFSLLVLGDKLLFVDSDKHHLYSTDGSEVQVLYDDAFINPSGGFPIVFESYAYYPDNNMADGLIRTNGIEEAEFVSGPDSPQFPLVVGDKMIFSSSEELWCTDGEETTLVKDFTGSSLRNPESIVAFNGLGYIKLRRDPIYQSDGTPTGTNPLQSGLSGEPLFEFAGHVYFAIDDDEAEEYGQLRYLEGATILDVLTENPFEFSKDYFVGKDKAFLLGYEGNDEAALYVLFGGEVCAFDGWLAWLCTIYGAIIFFIGRIQFW